MENFYTFYWLDGSKSVIKGDNVEGALDSCISAGAMKALIFYAEGLDNNWHYYKEEKAWKKCQPVNIHIIDIKNNVNSEALIRLLDWHKKIVINYTTNDQLVIECTWNHFSDGWIKTITIYFAEYFEGSFDGTGDEDHHYMVAGTEYHDPEFPTIAIESFINRINSDSPMFSHKDAKTVVLSELKEKQDQQELWKQ